MSGNGSFDHARPPFVVTQNVAEGSEGGPAEPGAMHISGFGQAKGQGPPLAMAVLWHLTVGVRPYSVARDATLCQVRGDGRPLIRIFGKGLTRSPPG